ncbi:hypothetical protein [Legionella sp. 29fVS95]|uniref:hypothetical protein n=1 Tax=Legionella sp. 29fVS95 TaxID=3402813 RepID=UPI003AF41FDA
MDKIQNSFYMSNNSATVFVFVKGNLGRYGYLVSDCDFNILYEKVEEDILNDEGIKKSPIHTDYEAIIKSLDYIYEHRGMDNIPSQPTIFLYTSFENNYHVCLTVKNADPKKPHMVEYVEKIKSLVEKLQRTNKTNKDEDVKFLFLPKKFINQMDIVDEMLVSSKENPRP